MIKILIILFFITYQSVANDSDMEKIYGGNLNTSPVVKCVELYGKIYCNTPEQQAEAKRIKEIIESGRITRIELIPCDSKTLKCSWGRDK